jgi:hypothetical protein
MRQDGAPPPQPDGVPGQPADLSAKDRGREHGTEVERTLAGGHGGTSDHGPPMAGTPAQPTATKAKIAR